MTLYVKIGETSKVARDEQKHLLHIDRLTKQTIFITSKTDHCDQLIVNVKTENPSAKLLWVAIAIDGGEQLLKVCCSSCQLATAGRAAANLGDAQMG